MQRVCVHFQLSELVDITESGEEVVVKIQHSKFCVLKNEKPENDWFFVFNLCFGEFSFIRWVVHMIQLLEQFLINGRICFLVTEILRYSVSASVNNLLAVGAFS